MCAYGHVLLDALFNKEEQSRLLFYGQMSTIGSLLVSDYAADEYPDYNHRALTFVHKMWQDLS